MIGQLDLSIRRDDLSSPEVKAMVARHLLGMHAHSPPESVHALGLEQLKALNVTFWSAWVDDRLAGMGALKRLDATRGEVKSMRVADAFLRRGVGRAILRRIVEEARALGLAELYLETGSSEAFHPALTLYESEGFVSCGPFCDYVADPFSRFMTRRL